MPKNVTFFTKAFKKGAAKKNLDAEFEFNWLRCSGIRMKDKLPSVSKQRRMIVSSCRPLLADKFYLLFGAQ